MRQRKLARNFDGEIDLCLVNGTHADNQRP